MSVCALSQSTGIYPSEYMALLRVLMALMGVCMALLGVFMAFSKVFMAL